MTQPATTTPGKTPARPAAGDTGSVKETLEQILVAFILAFIFRAFVVEAFVIPTGSMAPTLLGEHMRFRCPDCGYRFDANYTPPASDGPQVFRQQAESDYRVFCPNCAYKFPNFDAPDPENDAHHPPTHYGDRILVVKYLYLFRQAQRWDVVVFKSPAPEQNGSAPTYTENFIKRLIGRPGESVMILDGDIYIGKPGQEPAAYTVQTKPRYVQEALWRVIYDNDFHPRKLIRDEAGRTWKQPWTVSDGSGWDLDSDTAGRAFRFNNANGQSTLFFDRNADPVFDRSQNARPYAFTDWLAYDVETPPPWNPVHDLKLAFAYGRSAGDGELRAKITIGKDAFVAVLTKNDARLIHTSPRGEEAIGAPAKLPAGSDPVRVELTHVDYQVTLRINDVDVAQSTPQQYQPNVPALLEAYKIDQPSPVPTVEITAANQTAALSHVGLWRDIYYTNRQLPGQGGPPVWAIPFNLPNYIMHLGEDEYFVMGDNSLISGDGRYWQVPIHLPADELEVQSGRVPGRFLLGRAFFVYWPAGFRPAQGLPGISPNFGDMRFIR